MPGVIHHVIVRGLERREIFKDDDDRGEFIARLARSLKITDAGCYGWALVPNHFHLVVRTGKRSLSETMRRLLSGYAVYFNRRHRRSGYLYQNRYKSVLCQEDTYLLELVRYIHLNPYRARLVKSLQELNQYPWSGHAVLMGKRQAPWQAADEILLRFGQKTGEARAKYLEYVKSGMSHGRREDLAGGGLRRSAGGWEGLNNLKKAKEQWRGDERILGDGDFVAEVIKASEEEWKRKEKLKREGWGLKKLVARVCELKGVKAADILRRGGRGNSISQARALVAFWGCAELGISGVEIAKYFGISRPAVSQAANLGRHYAKGLSLA